MRLTSSKITCFAALVTGLIVLTGCYTEVATQVAVQTVNVVREVRKDQHLSEQKKQLMAGLSDKVLCGLALESVEVVSWSNDPNYKPYIEEANRRGHAPYKCDQLSGNKDAREDAAREKKYASVDDKTICREALKANSIDWNPFFGVADNVAEAERRGHSPNDCYALSGKKAEDEQKEAETARLAEERAAKERAAAEERRRREVKEKEYLERKFAHQKEYQSASGSNGSCISSVKGRELSKNPKLYYGYRNKDHRSRIFLNPLEHFTSGYIVTTDRDTIKWFAQEWPHRFFFGSMGLAIQNISAEAAQALGLKNRLGALAAKVEGPSKKAGLRVGDIIKSVNCVAVEKASDIVRILGFTPIARVPVVIIRDGLRKEITLELEFTSPSRIAELEQLEGDWSSFIREQEIRAVSSYREDQKKKEAEREARERKAREEQQKLAEERAAKEKIEKLKRYLQSLQPAGSGTAFRVSKTGHFLTNEHVVRDCRSVTLELSGESLETQIVATDPENDLAILKTKRNGGEVLPISSQNVGLAEEIWTAGYPTPKELGTTLKITRGIVSSLAGSNNKYSHIQIDASIQRGNSGGPIISSRGDVVAVAVAGYESRFQNVNYGIKASTVLPFLEANRIPFIKATKTDGGISSKEKADLLSAATFMAVCWRTGEELFKEMLEEEQKAKSKQ